MPNNEADKAAMGEKTTRGINTRLKKESEHNSIESLIAMLGGDDNLTHEDARIALVKIGKPAVPSLIKLLKNERTHVRWEAAKALASLGDPSSAPALTNTLDDKVFDVRWIAAEGLIGLGVQGLIPVFEALVSERKRDWLWEGAHHVIHDLAKGRLEIVLRPVLDAYDSPEPHLSVPLAARKALEELKSMQKSGLKFD
ncbi:MAG: HEAT repeat domain-containing protein [Dehalococcoidia bacterium]